MTSELRPGVGPDLFGQLAATDPYQRRARRLFERGQVSAVTGNEAEVRVSADAQGNPLTLKGVPIISGYVPRVGDWVAIQYEAGHASAPWIVGPSMAGDAATDPAGIGVFAVSDVAPESPQKSTIYFDETLGAWRGWDGTAWVDFFAKLHNTMPDLQGGTASQYYHFSQSAHDSLGRFLGAAGYSGGLEDGHLRRLSFSAIDASGTERTRLFEKDGDFFWAINAEYDAAGDHWDRIDTAKHAYLVGLYSKNGIPHEPGSLGGIAWWRAVAGANPVGDYTAVGGWELGFMMTMHRNFVMGGMNCEIDGAGSPPYGRLSQSGHEDPDCFTGILRNVWYEGNTLHSPKVAGEGSWGRDTTDHPCWMAGIVDTGFVWRHKAAGAGAFATSAWTQLMTLSATGSLSVSGLGATGGISIGTGNSADNDLLLMFNIDRAWQFEVDGNDANTRLVLRGLTGAKYFAISSPDGTDLITFYQSDTDANQFVNCLGAFYATGGLGVDHIKELSAGHLVAFDNEALFSANLRVGTYAAKGAEAFAGYITIKDAGGTARKVMICA